MVHRLAPEEGRVGGLYGAYFATRMNEGGQELNLLAGEFLAELDRLVVDQRCDLLDGGTVVPENEGAVDAVALVGWECLDCFLGPLRDERLMKKPRRLFGQRAPSSENPSESQLIQTQSSTCKSNWTHGTMFL